MATTNDLKNGLVLNIDGQLWTVVEFQHVKPGKGPAFVRTKLKNVLSGKVVDKTFNAGVKVETANVDKRTMQYLYNDGTDFIFMDPDTYDQLPVSPEVVGDAAKYLLENQDAIVARHDGSVLYIELAEQVGLPASGIGFPGHFLVRHDLADGAIVVDVFAGARALSQEELEYRLLPYAAGDSGHASRLLPARLAARSWVA